MPRGKGSSDPRKPAENPGYMDFAIFLNSVGADTEKVEEWDFKPDTIQDAVLAALSCGMALQFGMNRDRTAVSLVLWNAGTRVPMGYHEDSLSLEDKLIAITLAARKMRQAELDKGQENA